MMFPANSARKFQPKRKMMVVAKNTQVTVKVKDSHQGEAQVQIPKLFSIRLFLHPPVLEFLTNIAPQFFSKISNKAPPLSSRIALHIFNCIFRN
jgi:hypothetical protein